VEILHRLAVHRHREPPLGRGCPTACEHVRRAVDPLDVQPPFPQRQQGVAVPAAQLECRLAGLEDERLPRRRIVVDMPTQIPVEIGDKPV
jgi:hypothetical protein